MRSSTFSSMALLALTFFSTGVFAKPINPRALLDETVVVIKEIVVCQDENGELTTCNGPTTTTSRTTSTILPTPIFKPIKPAVFKEKAKLPPIPQPTRQAPVPIPQVPAPIPEAAVLAAAPAINPIPAVNHPDAAPVKSPKKSSASFGSSGGKRGVAFNDPSVLGLFANSPQVSWCYNWLESFPGKTPDCQYIPMLWGLKDEHVSVWEKSAKAGIAAGAPYLLGFNEPDHDKQSSLSVEKAVQGWKKYMDPFASKVNLVSPAVTNGQGEMGLTWLRKFLAACTNCQIDAVAIHWYNGGSIEDFKAHVMSARDIAGDERKVLLTEFQAPASGEDETKWLAEVLPWLDEQEYIAGYAYFMAQKEILINVGGGGLSELGKVYVS